MNISHYFLLLFLCGTLLFSATSANDCQKPPVQQDFDLKSYLGLWHEIARLPFSQEKDGYCITAEYTLKSDGHVKVDNCQRGSYQSNRTCAVGDAKVKNASDPAKLEVSFDPTHLFYGPYWVLKTDYQQFTVVFSCSDIIFKKIEYTWILARKEKLDSDVLDGLFEFIHDTLGLERSAFIMTPQDQC